MANGHGGKRTPRNPAPVSGPGSMSRRTDGAQPARYTSGMPYGDGQDFYDLQTSARMNESGPAVQPAVRSQGPAAPPQQVTPLFAPTERPDEPITAGAPFGPGPGPAPQPVAPGRTSLQATLSKLAQTSTDPQIAALLRVAERLNW